MRYGDVLPDEFVVPKSAFWIQKDLSSSNPFERLKIVEGDSVMDCGAFVGTFAAATLEQGADKVTCYEAMPSNALQLRQNLARYEHRAEIVEKALTASSESTTILTISNFSGAHSIVPSTKRSRSLQVQAVCFRNELLRLRPQVVKLDVEGAEYELLESLKSGDLGCVTALFIEFHPIDDRDARITKIWRFVEREGLTTVNVRLRAFTALRT